jgi:hypothetical protein
MAVQDGVDCAFGRRAEVLIQPVDEKLADIGRRSKRLLALQRHDQPLNLGRQLVSAAHRPPAAIGRRLDTLLFVSGENLVAGLSGYPQDRYASLIASPSRRGATNRRRSSISEHSFHGIRTLRQRTESVTHVSGTIWRLISQVPHRWRRWIGPHLVRDDAD